MYKRQVLGWGEAEIAREVEHYQKRVAAERESQSQPDDMSADAARLGAPDVRMGRTVPASQPIGEIHDRPTAVP